ncbi:MAG: prepilin peptidase, partial [Acidobacteria bacterium]|nr:prepilin peptidase [Acidobacteriota bacterium]
MPDAAIATLVFLFGLCTGSFLNVCIRRIPAGQSIVRPASRCPKCAAAIKPYDNIPVLSYLFLRGRCRNCRAPISFVYPAVELLTGLIFLACYLMFGPTLAAAKWMLFSALLIVLVFTDIFERILPDPVNFGGLATGLLLSL